MTERTSSDVVQTGNIINIPSGIYDTNVQKTVSAAGGSGTMEFYKCSAVYGPHKVTRIKVENAGTTAVNGDYELTTLKTSSGGEVWKHLEAEFYLYNLTDYWCIDSDYTTYGDMALYYTWNSNLTEWSCGYDFDTSSNTGIEPTPTVSKFQVTLDEDVPKTWDGYKAILADGIYTFENTLTSGLIYGDYYIPEIGNIYSADTMIKICSLFDDIINRFPGGSALFAIDANIGINDLVAGTAPTLVRKW